MEKNTNQLTADVILRSSDGKLFYSWKTLLSISSPVFSDMFAFPQPDTKCNVDDGRPVVDLTEDSCTLEHILSLCHPTSHTGKMFDVGCVRELGALLEATIKYDMENIRCVIFKELTNPSLLREESLVIYALACRCECYKAAQLAAKHTLALPTLVSEYEPELERIHAGKLCRLLLYREECATAALSVVHDHRWISYTHLSSLFGCDGSGDEDMPWTIIRYPPSRKYRSGREERVSVHMWWIEYMKKSGYALQKSPHGGAVKDQVLVNDALAAISSSKCKECKAFEVGQTFLSFVDMFAKEVEQRVADIEIDFDF